jgi:hypothetical protein
MMQNVIIIKLQAHDDFTITIFLNNRRSFIFDIKPYLAGSGFKKLRQLSFFKQAKFKGDLLYWDSMHDFPLHCMDIPKDV